MAAGCRYGVGVVITHARGSCGVGDSEFGGRRGYKDGPAVFSVNFCACGGRARHVALSVRLFLARRDGCCESVTASGGSICNEIDRFEGQEAVAGTVGVQKQLC